MVLPVQSYRLPENEVAIESAFLEHLRRLKRTLPAEIGILTIMSPKMSEANYRQRAAYLASFSQQTDGIEVLPLEPGDVGRLRFNSRYLWSCSVDIWRAVKESTVVHAGPSHIYRLSEFVSILAAIVQRRPSVFVVDLDWREGPRMNRATGRWPYRSYLLAQYIYSPLFSMQVRIACRFCSLVLLKGQGLVDTYGQGRDHVKNILDPAHSIEHIIDQSGLSRKLKRLRDPHTPLLLTYFGRLTAYKGIDFCLSVLKELESRAPGRFALRIIGAGEEEGSLKRQTDDLGLAALVEFTGALQFGPELFSAIQGCDIALATPLAPDAPRSSLDAMCSGLPLLAFDTEYYQSLGRLSGAVAISRWNSIESAVHTLMELEMQRQRLAQMAVNAVDFAVANTQDIWLARRAAWLKEFCFAQA